MSPYGPWRSPSGFNDVPLVVMSARGVADIFVSWAESLTCRRLLFCVRFALGAWVESQPTYSSTDLKLKIKDKTIILGYFRLG